MPDGALDLTEPAHLLAKLEYESGILAADHGNSYAAINALRDAHHLREWIWHDRLEHDPALQYAIMTQAGQEGNWNRHINTSFPDFPTIRELCNGSKHFERATSPTIQNSYKAGWNASVWDNGEWDDKGFYVVVNGQVISITNLAARVCQFWRSLFNQFPQLG